MSAPLPPTPLSPGVGARRKGPGRHPPTLPLSAFTPPNTGASDSTFPLPSPGATQPQSVIDANVIAPGGDLKRWKVEAGESLIGRLGGVVLSLHGLEPAAVEKALEELPASIAETGVNVIAVLVPFALEQGAPTDLPSYLSPQRRSEPPIVLSAIYTTTTPQAIEALNWAITHDFTVDIDVQVDLRQGDGAWEAFEELLNKSAVSTNTKGNIILSNILPPPDDLTLPIVKLLSHHTYREFQARTAELSLYANLFIKYLPPVWGAATPPTPAPVKSEAAIESDSKEKKEWKRRIKMYIGHAMEAFGFQRIIFGSSPSPASHASSNAADWYTLGLEAFAELGVEQEGVDAVFFGNAKRAYASSS